MDPRASVDSVENRKICHCRIPCHTARNQVIMTELCLALLKEYFMAVFSPDNKDFPYLGVHEDVCTEYTCNFLGQA